MAYPIPVFIYIHNRTAETINELESSPGVQSIFQGFVDAVHSEIGLLLLAYSGQRSYAQQWELRKKYLAGGNRAASPGGSWHNFGRAIDVIPVNNSGKPIWEIEPSTWKRIEQIAARYGLKSGAIFGDPGHFKYDTGANLVQLRKSVPGWESYAAMEDKVEKDGDWVKPLIIVSLVGLAGFAIFTQLKDRK